MVDAMKYYLKKTIVITGAATGIGAAFAYLLARWGARLALVDVQERALKQTADKIVAQGWGEPLCLIADVSNFHELESAFQRAVEKFGNLGCR